MQSIDTSLGAPGAFTLLAVACLTIMVGGVIVPGLPSVATGLGLPSSGSWLVTLPSLGVVLFAPLAGRLITRVGPRQALRLGLALYGALGMACIWLRGPVAVFADRLLLGGATVVVMAAGTGLIAQFYQGAARLEMIAWQGMAIEFGGVVFLSLAGVLAGIGWRWPFLIYLFAWICLVLVETTLPSVTPAGHDDEARARPPEPMRSSSMMDAYFAAMASMLVFFIAIVTLPIRLHALGLSEAETGYFLSFVSLVAVAAAFCMPRVAHRLRDAGTLMLGFAIYAVGRASLGLATTLTGMIVGGALLGGGFGLTVPLINHMVVERSTPALLGHNLSYLSMALFLGQFPASFVGLLTKTASSSFLVAAGLAVAAAMTVAGLRSRRP